MMDALRQILGKVGNTVGKGVSGVDGGIVSAINRIAPSTALGANPSNNLSRLTPAQQAAFRQTLTPPESAAFRAATSPQGEAAWIASQQRQPQLPVTGAQVQPSLSVGAPGAAQGSFQTPFALNSAQPQPQNNLGVQGVGSQDQPSFGQGSFLNPQSPQQALLTLFGRN
jgi:hypothetical protein